ncbi:S1 family peptidase [Mesorhizobium neociceri]|uniref:Trypsin-like peptidase domain-containing protein n=1 Tax=Mesorhizobium neociceri TaxID=1307853 RepID=A0A838B8S8_9HYPH|nr:serine protease [Mesorhizobium neociceri]MBA1142835.1 trypsin-like peptidase domain-containing protein [Mesorhizobium neociceri]
MSDQESKHQTAQRTDVIKQLYREYGAALVAIITTDVDGDEHIGTAFHVGDGSFVTARHVLDGQAKCRVELDGYRISHLGGDEDFDEETIEGFDKLEVHGLGHPDPMTDVAVFSIPQLSGLPAVPLGSHLDDWITDHDFVLNEVLVLGFPPIPLSKRSVLVAARGQINAVIDLINVNFVHFIVSVPPKGGFSGGVVMSEWGFALGVVTASLVKNHSPEELGYLTVLTVEPILECLAAHELLPRAVALTWDGLFTRKVAYFGKPEHSWAQAWVETDRDGHRTRMQLACPDERVARRALDAALAAVPHVKTSYSIVGKGVHEVSFHGEYASLVEPLKTAADAASMILIVADFLPVESPSVIHRALTRDFLVMNLDLASNLPDA